MERYYALDSELSFVWMSWAHVLALLLIVIVNVAIYLLKDKMPKQIRRYLRLSLVLLLILQEVALQTWEARSGIWSIDNSLPLQLCSISLVLTAIMLLSKNKNIYQVVYFWGVAGASQALLTPELYYGFPHFVFLQFFLAHGLIVTGCLWMTFVEGYRPSFAALAKAFAMINLYAAIIGIFNNLTGSNYLFICRKPANPSLLDYLGAWPWYIISLEAVALLLFTCCALPYLWAEVRTKRHRDSMTPM